MVRCRTDGEEILHGGTHGPVVRVGDTVRRAARPSTPAVSALLRHLELAGFTGAPRALGLDESGREVLSYIPGQVVGQRGSGTAPSFTRSEECLVGIARLLRQFHDATTTFKPPLDAAWTFQVGAPRSGDVVCHNDIGLWNTVFRDGLPCAFIDFDTAAPAPREWDVAYVLYRFVPFVPDAICEIIGWSEPPDRRRRTERFCEAYGMQWTRELLATIVHRIEVIRATGLALVADRDPRYGEQWLRIILPRLDRDIAFVSACISGR